MLANTASGLKIVQLFRGDAMEEEKKARRYFRPLKARTETKRVGRVWHTQKDPHLELVPTKAHTSQTLALANT